MTSSAKELKELRKKNQDIKIPDRDLKIESFNKVLSRSYEDNKLIIKQVKNKLCIKDADIANMFGYKNDLSYRN